MINRESWNLYFSQSYDSSQQVTPPPFLFLVSIIHPSHDMFILIIFNESTKPLCRIHKAVFSILIHLSPHPSQFLLGVFFIYSSKAHHKFSEHCSQIPAFVHLWRLPVRAAGLGADSWLFLTLSLSLSISLCDFSQCSAPWGREWERSICL